MTDFAARIYVWALFLLLSPTSIAQKFGGFGQPSFETITTIKHNDDTAYPSVDKLDIIGSQIFLNGFYRFCSDDVNYRSSSTANNCAFICSSGEFCFLQSYFGEGIKLINPTQSHHLAGMHVLNLLDTDNSQPIFWVYKEQKARETQPYLNSVAIKISPSGKFILAQKFSENTENLPTNCILEQKADNLCDYVVKKELLPKHYSTAALINERWTNTIQRAQADYVFGYIFDSESSLDKLAAWDCESNDTLLLPSYLIKNQELFYECFAVSKNNRYLIGAQHSARKNLRERNALANDVIYPFLLEADDQSLTPKILKCGIICSGQYQNFLVPGIANVMSPCGQILFGMHTVADSYVQTPTSSSSSSNSVSNNIPDLVSRFLSQAEMGIIPKSFSRSIHATLCINRIGVFYPLKDILVLLLSTELESKKKLLARNNKELQSEIEDLENELEKLKKWHLIQVMVAEYGANGNLVFAGLGLNPQNNYELFYFQYHAEKLCEILNLNFRS